MFQKYYCIKQHDKTDCGAACLATISKQYGLRTSITKIREMAGTDKQGTNAYGVIKAAEQLWFSSKGVKGDNNAFYSEFPLPCIAHVIVDGALLHYVVIHKITKKQVIIANPGKGIVKITPEEFFGEKVEEGKAPTYQWSGVLILLGPNNTFEKYDISNKESLLEELSNYYTDIDKRVLEFDVMELLYLMDVYGIINIENPNDIEDSIYMQNSTNVQYKIVGDINYKLVSGFIINALSDNSIKFCQETNEDFYKPVSLRMRVVNNYEYGVFSVVNNEIYSYMSISTNSLTISSVLNINTLFFKADLSKDKIKELLLGMINRILRILSGLKSFKKVRLTLCENDSESNLIEILKEIDFKLECILENETVNGNIVFYTLLLRNQ